MRAVFVGGSRKLSKLNAVVRTRLESIIQKGLWVLVGDANGADKALQRFFVSHDYDRVLVYCVDGRFRNNLGRWQIRPVEPPLGAQGFDYYAAKDIQMAADSSFGLMLWDGLSRGTLANIRNLLAHRKPVAVYVSPLRQFRDLKLDQDFAALLPLRPAPRKPRGRVPSHAQQELPLRPGRRRKGNAA